jgi:hypothetical protein
MSLITLISSRWRLSLAALFVVGLLSQNAPVKAAEEATLLETIQIFTGNYRKWSKTDAIGHLGGVPVMIPKEFANFLEYDDDPGFLEKRKGEIPKRTFESGIRSFGFEVRYPDMAPVNDQTWRDKRKENIYTTMWMSVGVRSNSRYQDRSPARMARILVSVWLENSSLFYRYEEQPSQIYGLTAFVPVNADVSRRSAENHNSNDENIYIHRLDKDHVDAYISCSNNNLESVTCQQRFSLEPVLKASVDVRYRKGLLPKWREIQNSVTQVLLNFRVDTSNSPSLQSQSSRSLLPREHQE